MDDCAPAGDVEWSLGDPSAGKLARMAAVADNDVYEHEREGDWRLDGDYDQLVGLEITLVEARQSRHVGRVLYTKRRGNGVKLFHTAGLYQLRISSTLARWRLRMKAV